MLQLAVSILDQTIFLGLLKERSYLTIVKGLRVILIRLFQLFVRLCALLAIESGRKLSA